MIEEREHGHESLHEISRTLSTWFLTWRDRPAPSPNDAPATKGDLAASEKRILAAIARIKPAAVDVSKLEQKVAEQKISSEALGAAVSASGAAPP